MKPDYLAVFNVLIAFIAASVAAAGLFQNSSAVRKNNRIVVSTKLAEASKLLTDELVAQVQSYQMYKRELKEAQAYPESETKAKKISDLEKLIEASLARQNQIDKETDEIKALFSNLDQVDPGEIDMKIIRSYRNQSTAAGKLEFAREIKRGNAE